MDTLWNAYITNGGGVVAGDASEEIDKMRKLVEDFEGETIFFIAPHSVIRWYEEMLRVMKSSQSTQKCQQRTDQVCSHITEV